MFEDEHVDEDERRRFEEAHEVVDHGILMMRRAHAAEVQGIPRLVAVPEKHGNSAIIMEDAGRRVEPNGFVFFFVLPAVHRSTNCSDWWTAPTRSQT